MFLGSKVQFVQKGLMPLGSEVLLFPDSRAFGCCLALSREMCGTVLSAFEFFVCVVLCGVRQRLPVVNVEALLQIAFVGDQGYEGC